MSENSSNNKRIAKNTLLLYVRMLFLMFVSLYTSRVILNALGVEDYGIYNVVGGVVAMFSVLSQSLSSAISRFLTFELGRKNREKLVKIFSSSVIIQIYLALIILLLAETLGLWFLKQKMVIPDERMFAAQWVFHLSILTFCFNLLYVPYHAVIIAHERMGAFAYISIVEAMLKLGVAYLITVSPMDRLISYAILMAVVAISIILLYAGYSISHFEECRLRFSYDRFLLKEMFTFAGWSFIGTSANIFRDQGGNIILNLFCGPMINAARGISVQVNNALQGFVSNFMLAMNPQIIKSYAIGDREYLMELIFRGSRFSFYILFLLSLPILLETEYILRLWLVTFPSHTVFFVQLTLLLTLHDCLSYPLVTTMLATGKIRNYQIIAGGLNMLNLPIGYYLLKKYEIPEAIFIVAIFISVVVQIARLILLKHLVNIDIGLYLKKIYANILIVALLSAIVPLFISQNLPNTIMSLISVTFVSLLFSSFVIIYVGCNNEERKYIKEKLSLLKERIRDSYRN